MNTVLEQAEYLKGLKTRARTSHVYRKYQLLGLEIATILDDQRHKALYIKLAKEGNGDELLRLAKTIAEKKGVKNKGAYFMSCAKELRQQWKSTKKKIKS